MSIKRTIIVTAAILASVAMVAPTFAGAVTVSDLMAQIAALQAQLNSLSNTTTTTVTSGTGACAGVTFTRNLVIGSTGSDVKCLQTILNQSATTQVSATGAGSPGNETTYFGAKTLAAVKIYQAAHGMTPANQVGPMTRASLNAALGTTTTTTTTTGTLPTGCTSTAGFSPLTGVSCATGAVTNQAGTISASLASDTPASSAIIKNQANAGLLNINFTGTGTITSISLQRSGISTSDTLSNVYLYDGNTRLTSGYTFNTNSQIVMNNLSIAVSGSKTIAVKADVASDATDYSSSIAVTLIGFTANSTTASSNVTGNTMSVVTGNIATATFTTGSAVVSPDNTSINAGSMGQTLWSRNINVTPRAVYLSGLTVKMIGSAPSNTLANVGLFIDGVLAGNATINTNSQFIFHTSNPVTLSTGSHLLEVRGDIVGGSYRNFYLSLEQGSDVVLQDSQLGVYVSALAGSPAVTAININGGTVSIQKGSLILSQDTTFNNTTTIVGGATNVTMASYKFTAYGEDVKVTSLTLTPSISGLDVDANSQTTLTNVGLYVNGGQVGSNKTATDTVALTFPNIGSSLTVPVGTSVIVSIKGDVIATGGHNYATGSESFNIASGAAQGTFSSENVTVSPQGGQTLAISNSNVTFAESTGFAPATPAPNSVSVKIGSFILQTASAEGITINNIAVTFPAGGGNTLIPHNQLTNLKVMSGSNVIGTPIGQPVITTPNNFSTNTVVGISSSTVFNVYADIGSDSLGRTVTPSMLISYRGNTSNTSTSTNAGTPTPATSTTTADVASIANTDITFSSGLTSQFVTGNGSSTLPIATFNVKTNNNVGGAVIKDVTFDVNANTIQSITMSGKTASVVSGAATIYNAGITVPSDNSGVNIPVTVQLVCIGTGCSGVSDSDVDLSIKQLTYNDGSVVQCVGDACPTPTAAIAAAASTLSLVGTVPSISLIGSATTGLYVGNQQIGTFTISAGQTGDIKLQQIPIVTGVNGTITIPGTTVELRDASGNVLTNAPAAVDVGAQDFVFGTPRTISKGTSETYTVYATTGGATGAAGTSNVTFSLGAKADFTWTDVTGGAGGIGISGTGIYNYPTASQTKSN
jgi:hypothetical protein